jgi:hypothetical protein
VPKILIIGPGRYKWEQIGTLGTGNLLFPAPAIIVAIAKPTVMARLASNSLFSAIQGRIGKEIVFKQYADKVVISIYPRVPKTKPTELQMIYRNRLKEANAFARSVKRDWELRKQYEKDLKPGESVFHKAKKEYFERWKKK